ncbi:hypothetical protein 44RRORF245c [Aeromonas phage 44RR2.8t]|uniref:Uncharacterized protein n=2 Tax=Biquartavirus 44RR2 TaxID=115987 RepID=Q6U957_9CAUD|nr:hypothetical protein ST44RRORF245c [Aeromonas phage 44RR2.8t]AAQ81563.1 hypothetical protein 44RRORF245c [Aeromonas phage 44RR2.8t]APU00717.1 hypothetical protein [Aeromonas phage 44RR2.8t.2]
MKLYVLEHIETGKPASFIKDSFDDIVAIDYNEFEPVLAHSSYQDMVAILENNHVFLCSRLNKTKYVVKEIG